MDGHHFCATWAQDCPKPISALPALTQGLGCGTSRLHIQPRTDNPLTGTAARAAPTGCRHSDEDREEVQMQPVRCGRVRLMWAGTAVRGHDAGGAGIMSRGPSRNRAAAAAGSASWRRRWQRHQSSSAARRRLRCRQLTAVACGAAGGGANGGGGSSGGGGGGGGMVVAVVAVVWWAPASWDQTLSSMPARPPVRPSSKYCR